MATQQLSEEEKNTVHLYDLYMMLDYQQNGFLLGADLKKGYIAKYFPGDEDKQFQQIKDEEEIDFIKFYIIFISKDKINYKELRERYYREQIIQTRWMACLFQPCILQFLLNSRFQRAYENFYKSMTFVAVQQALQGIEHLNEQQGNEVQQAYQQQMNSLKQNTYGKVYEKTFVKDFLSISINIGLLAVEIFDYASDILLLVLIYDLSKIYTFNLHYLTFSVVYLFSIVSPYLVAYSSGVQLFIQKGFFDSDDQPLSKTEGSGQPGPIGEPGGQQSEACLTKKKFLQYSYITFLGPIYFIFLHALDVFIKVADLALFFIPHQYYIKGKLYLMNLPVKFGMEQTDFEGFLLQKSICQLMFESLPLAIINVLFLTGGIQMPELTNGNPTSVYMGLASTCLNIVKQLIMLKIISGYLQEDMLTFSLVCMKARFGFIPFLKSIKEQQLTKHINFSKIRVPLPWISPVLGFFYDIPFSFSDISFNQFTNEIIKMQERIYLKEAEERHQKKLKDEQMNAAKVDEKDKAEEEEKARDDDFGNGEEQEPEKKKDTQQQVKRKKIVLEIATSIDRVSIFSLLQFYQTVDKSLFDIDFKYINWKKSIQFSRKIGAIPKNNQEKWDGYLLNGSTILQVCIDTEVDANNFDLQHLLRMLLKENTNPDIPDINGDSALLFCLKNKKSISQQILEPYSSLTFYNNKLHYTPISYLLMIDNSIDCNLLLKYLNFNNQEQINFHQKVVKSLDQSSGSGEGPNITLLGYIIDRLTFYQINVVYGTQLVDILVSKKAFVTELESQEYVNGMAYCFFLASKLHEQLQQAKLIDRLVEKEEHKYTFKSQQNYNIFHCALLKVEEERDMSYLYSTIKQFYSENKQEQVLQHMIKEGDLLETMLQETGQIPIRFAHGQLQLVLDYVKSELSIQSKLYLCKFLHTYISKNEDEDIHNLKHYYSAFQLILSKTGLSHSDFVKEFKEYLRQNFVQNTGVIKRLKEKQFIDEETELFLVEHLKKMEEEEKQLLLIKQKQKEEIKQDVTYVQIRQDNNQGGKEPTISQQPKGQILPVVQVKEGGEGKEAENHIQLYTLASAFVLDVLALIDLISDIIVLVSLIQIGHAGWSAITILSITSPYLIQYAPLITLFMFREAFTSPVGKLFSFFFITPLSMAYLIILDVIYILLGVTSNGILLVLYILTCGRVVAFDSEELLDRVFQKFFNLNNMDVRGLRKLRSLSQLLFESGPQFILQVRIMIYGADQLGVTFTTLLYSVILAGFHALIEVTLFVIESKTFKTTKLYYAVVCLNGRLNWVPFLDSFTRKMKRSKQKASKKSTGIVSAGTGPEINANAQAISKVQPLVKDPELIIHNDNIKLTQGINQSDMQDNDQLINKPTLEMSKLNKEKDQSKNESDLPPPPSELAKKQSSQLQIAAESFKQQSPVATFLDYDNLCTQVCGFQLTEEFEFYDETVMIFVNVISLFPMQFKAKKENLLGIKVGRCCRNVSITNFIQLLQLCYKRVNLIHQDVNWQLMLKSIPRNCQFVTQIGEGWVPLLAYVGCDQGIKTLLSTQKELNVNVKSIVHDKYPLHLAILEGHSSTVRELVQHGADTKIINENRQNMLEVILQIPNWEVLATYIKHTVIPISKCRHDIIHTVLRVAVGEQQQFKIAEKILYLLCGVTGMVSNSLEYPHCRILSLINNYQSEVVKKWFNPIKEQHKALIWVKIGQEQRQLKTEFVECFKQIRIDFLDSMPFGSNQQRQKTDQQQQKGEEKLKDDKQQQPKSKWLGDGSFQEPYDFSKYGKLYFVMYDILDTDSVLNQYAKNEAELRQLVKQLDTYIDDMQLEQGRHKYFMATQSVRKIETYEFNMPQQEIHYYDYSVYEIGVRPMDSFEPGMNSRKVGEFKLNNKILNFLSIDVNADIHDHGWGNCDGYRCQILAVYQGKQKHIFDMPLQFFRDSKDTFRNSKQKQYSHNSKNYYTLLDERIVGGTVSFYIMCPQWSGCTKLKQYFILFLYQYKGNHSLMEGHSPISTVQRKIEVRHDYFQLNDW